MYMSECCQSAERDLSDYEQLTSGIRVDYEWYTRKLVNCSLSARSLLVLYALSGKGKIRGSLMDDGIVLNKKITKNLAGKK